MRNTRNRITRDAGAIDLGAILVGVLLVGILGGIIAAAVFAVVPWAQDNSARADLAAVHVAQGAAKSDTGNYLDTAALADAGFIHASTAIRTKASADGSCWVGVTRSATGNYFRIGSDTLVATEVDINDPASPGCVDEATWAYLTWQGEEPVGPGGPHMWLTVDPTGAVYPQCTTIRLPIRGTVDVSIDWGDGTITSHTQADSDAAKIEHTYVGATDPAQIRITGTFTTWAGVHTPVWSRSCILTVNSWAETLTTNMVYGFYQTARLTKVAAVPDTITTMEWAFYQNLALTEPLDLTVPNLTTANSAFYQFDGNAPVTLRTSPALTNVARMFYGARYLNQPVIITDTSAVTSANFAQMFQNATVFNQDLTGLRTDSVTTVPNSFRSGSALVQANVPVKLW